MGLDRNGRLHLGSDVRQDQREGLGGNVPGHRVRSHDAAVQRACVDRATVGSEAVWETRSHRAGEVHVDHGTRRRRGMILRRLAEEGQRTGTAAHDSLRDRDGAVHDNARRQIVALGGFGDKTPGLGMGVGEALEQQGLGRAHRVSGKRRGDEGGGVAGGSDTAGGGDGDGAESNHNRIGRAVVVDWEGGAVRHPNLKRRVGVMPEFEEVLHHPRRVQDLQAVRDKQNIRHLVAPPHAHAVRDPQVSHANRHDRFDTISGVDANGGIGVGDADEQRRIAHHEKGGHGVDHHRHQPGRAGFGGTGGGRQRGGQCRQGGGVESSGHSRAEAVATRTQRVGVSVGHGSWVGVLGSGGRGMRLSLLLRAAAGEGGGVARRCGSVRRRRARGAGSDVRERSRTSLPIHLCAESRVERATLATRGGVVGAVGSRVPSLAAEAAVHRRFLALLAGVPLLAADQAGLRRVRRARPLIARRVAILAVVVTVFAIVVTGKPHSCERCNQGCNVGRVGVRGRRRRIGRHGRAGGGGGVGVRGGLRRVHLGPDLAEQIVIVRQQSVVVLPAHHLANSSVRRRQGILEHGDEQLLVRRVCTGSTEVGNSSHH